MTALTKRQRAAYGTLLAVFCVIMIVFGVSMAPPIKEQTCAAGEAAYFKDGWWCVQARKP